MGNTYFGQRSCFPAGVRIGVHEESMDVFAQLKGAEGLAGSSHGMGNMGGILKAGVSPGPSGIRGDYNGSVGGFIRDSLRRNLRTVHMFLLEE